MRHALWLKFIAVALCAAALLAAAGGGLGLGVLASEDLLGEKTFEEAVAETTETMLPSQACRFAANWASMEYGDMPEYVANTLRDVMLWDWLDEDGFAYTILDEDGELLYSYGSIPEAEQDLEYTFQNLEYEQFLAEGFDEEARLEEGVYYTSRYDNTHGGVRYTAKEQTLEAPVTVVLSLAPGAIAPNSADALLGQLSVHKNLLPAALFGGLLLFAVCAVYLCCAAGCRKGTEEIRAGGLNALPLDLYAGGVILVVALCITILDELDFRWLERQSMATLLWLGGSMGYGCCLAFVGFCFAFAAQVKMENEYWIANTLLGRCLKLAFRVLKKCWAGLLWLLPGLYRLTKRILKDIWKVSAALAVLGWDMTKKLFAWLHGWLRRFVRLCEGLFSRLPLIWQWLVVGMVLVLWLLVAVAERMESMMVLWCCCALAVVLYGANCFGALLDGAKRMRSGDLKTKVDDKYLIGTFREFAEELNGLADVAVVAAQNQLKSERMKTELITNVSHDIKTPLTSIINYVDLLEKPHTPEEEKTYLEVLNRQSHRMKKLIEDLMEMSKASTGNISVEIAQIDAAEAVNQALGEFADKLEAAGVTPVFHNTVDVLLLADGRLLWRTMSNILSNAVKYALPGTRLYVDVGAVEDKAVISFKNISGAQLNISADELMERFVRGDSSRNTEGSGLGLNIAKSLMELQNGQLQLLVDGDLFKVTLIFPRA